MLYLALLLNNMGYHVLISDFSMERDFLVMFSDSIHEEFVRYKNVDITFRSYGGKKYHFIFNYLGDERYNDDLKNCRYIIINSSMKRQESFAHIEWICNTLKETILIIRDTIKGQIDKELLYMHDMTNVKHVFEIPLDYMDKDYQTQIDLGSFLMFKYLSKKVLWYVNKTCSYVYGKTHRFGT